MTREAEKPEWKQVKAKIKSKFGKLSDSEVEGLHGHMDKLTNTVKKAYNYDQKKAEQECKAFNETLERSK